MRYIFMSMIMVFLAGVLIAAAGITYAQDTGIAEPVKKKRRTEQFIGVQLNELIRQVTISDVTSTARQNPYLLTYAENSIRTNWGVRVGLGLQIRAAKGVDPALGVDTSSKVEAVWMRAGTLHTINLTRKLATGIGMDIVYSNVERISNNVRIGFGFDNSTKVVMYGAGPVATLKYQFTEHIALGTETSLYYLRGYESIDFDSRPLMELSFNLPVAIYFIIRF